MVQDRLKVAVSCDSHMDVGAMGGIDAVMDGYLVSRDPALVKERPGKHVMWFETRRLTEDEMDWCELAPNDAEKWRRAFRVGVTQMHHPRLTDGRSPDTWLPEGEVLTLPSGRTVQTWSVSQMGLVSRAVKFEVGFVVYRRSFLAHESAISFLPLPMFRTSLAETSFHHADESAPQSAGPSSDKPASPSPEAPPSAAA